MKRRLKKAKRFLIEELRKRGVDPKEFMDRKKIDSISTGFQVSNYNDFMYAIAVKSIKSIVSC